MLHVQRMETGCAVTQLL